MPKLRFILLLIIALTNYPGIAQFSSFLGVSVTPGIGYVRNIHTAARPSYGGGISYALWEYDNGYLKTGLEFYQRSSGILEIPKYFEVPPKQMYDPIDISYRESNIVFPLQGFFMLFPKKGNALLLAGGIEIIYTLQEKYTNDTYGISTVSGGDINLHLKTGIMAGAGYQRKINNYMFLNILSSVNLDVKSDNPFIAYELTFEFLYGVY